MYGFVTGFETRRLPVAYRDFSQNAQNGQKVPKNGGNPPPIRATLLQLFSINLAQKRCLYLVLPLLGQKKNGASLAFIWVLPLLGKTTEPRMGA